MTAAGLGRRGLAAGAAACLATPHVARAATTRLRFLTSWFAEAEHGGYYQALATGLYRREGLDVTIDMGGPQVNGMQLLLGGAADIISSYDIQTLTAVANGLPVIAVSTTFQSDLQGMMTHPDIAGLAALKGHRIFLANTAYVTFWPWLRKRFGFTDDQTAPYTFNLQPFLLDRTAAVQAYSTSEPFAARQEGAEVRFFLFADQGYPPYGRPNVTTRAFLAANGDAIRRFNHASMLGWRDYLADPAPGNALIRRANPKMSAAQLAFAVGRLKALNLLGGGDAARGGIGTMTAARWQRTYAFLVDSRLLAPQTDWRAAFSTGYLGTPVMPA